MPSAPCRSTSKPDACAPAPTASVLPDVATVRRSSGPTYTDAPIERGSVQPGQIICVRTNAHRLALITIVSASEQAVEFGVTVWDPPVPS
jgi:hypothetical protein